MASSSFTRSKLPLRVGGDRGIERLPGVDVLRHAAVDLGVAWVVSKKCWRATIFFAIQPLLLLPLLDEHGDVNLLGAAPLVSGDGQG